MSSLFLLLLLLLLLNCICIDAFSFFNTNNNNNNNNNKKVLPRISVRSTTTPSTQLRAATALLQRVLPRAHVKFRLALLSPPATTTDDVFELDNGVERGSVVVRGSSGVALASGVYWYLKYYCNASVSWGEEGSGDNLAFLDRADAPLPAVRDAPVRRVSAVPLRYYMNVCTNSYSMAFWNWARWEREIDWMALNGINFPLSFTAAEYINRELFLELGVARRDLDAFFSGPAFLAWHRMGNLRAWAGPLTDEWIDGQAALQRQILARQRELGMVSVLPGFAGFVPEALVALYPAARIEPSTQWWNTQNASLCCNHLLRPEEPLWKTIGVRFYQLLVEKFGTDHVYNCDMFNEMTPASDDPAYLRQSAAAVIDAMTEADERAVWLMQGWLFYSHQRFWRPPVVESYLSGVANDRMIILDLVSEDYPLWQRLSSFFGKPFIWCLLHNFGAVRGMYGNLTHIGTAPLLTLAHADSTMIGTGLSMEAIEHNPVVYELMNEVAWHSAPLDVPRWLRGYVVRRYGADDDDLQSAWQLLHRSAYATNVFAKSYMEAEPMIEMQRRTIGWFWMHSEHRTAAIDATTIVEAWRALARAAERGVAPRNGPFEYDLVDLTRQVMANLFFDAHVLFEYHFHAFIRRNGNALQSVERITAAMLTMISETDAVLGANVNYLLGRWIAAARSWSERPDEQARLQFNAMNLITLWGPEGEINDYSTRPWSGLYSSYYYERWKLLFDRVVHLLRTGKPVGGYRTALQTMRRQWGRQNAVNLWPTQPSGDVRRLVTTLVGKYAARDTKARYVRVGGRSCPPTVCERLIDDARLVLWTRDEYQLSWLCDLDSMCAGFDTDGVLYRKVGAFEEAEQGTDAVLVKRAVLTESEIAEIEALRKQKPRKQ